MTSILNNPTALTLLTRAAWASISLGQDIISLSEALEELDPRTMRSNLAWQLRTLGENTEHLGERLEAYCEVRAEAAGVSIRAVLGPLVAA